MKTRNRLIVTAAAAIGLALSAVSAQAQEYRYGERYGHADSGHHYGQSREYRGSRYERDREWRKYHADRGREARKREAEIARERRKRRQELAREQRKHWRKVERRYFHDSYRYHHPRERWSPGRRGHGEVSWRERDYRDRHYRRHDKGDEWLILLDVLLKY
ncbi:MAG: hypothetical protein ACQETO_08650 [Pseudomonadota bacterium]